MAVVPEKSDLTWNQPYVTGDAPLKRSGHTFTVIGSNGFLFGGVDASEPAGPNNEVYQLKMAGNFEWVKLDLGSTAPNDEKPLARWKHSCCSYDKKFLVVFGGFHSSTQRLNDVWIIDTITLNWQLVSTNPCAFTPRGNHTSASQQKELMYAPSPRGAHSASCVGQKMWIFGGYGGMGYSRRDFNDIHVLDLENQSWEKPPSIKGTPPKPRSGHSASVVNEKIYVFGGWNSVEQFKDLFLLDTVNLTWETIECYTEPRWNHAVCSVEAIPNWKIFVFGGCTGNLQETKKAQGVFSNSVMVFDSGSNTFDIPNIPGKVPSARADTQLAYDSKGSRLVFFGGWRNKWLDDIYTLDVGCVVGPPYAIMGIYPLAGPITGDQEITIKGIDFIDDPRDPRIKVRFATKRGVEDVAATFVDKETITCKTPNFQNLADEEGEISVDVRVSFKDDSFTTTFQRYTFFPVSDAKECLAFGPGIISGGCPGTSTTFIINANDTSGNIRTAGGDEFSVTVVESEGGSNNIVTDVMIDDMEDGTYQVTYTPPAPGTYQVSIQFEGSFKDVTGKVYETGNAGHIRGSPFEVTFEDGASKATSKINGPLVADSLEKNYQNVRKFITSCRVQLEKAINPDSQKDLAADVKLLLAIKEKLLAIQLEKTNIELILDTMMSTVQYLAKAFDADMRKKIKSYDQLEQDWSSIIQGGSNNMIALAQSAIKPFVLSHGESTKTRIQEYETKVAEYEEEVKLLPFFKWDTGPEGAAQTIAKATDVHDLKMKETEEIKKLAQLFEFPELCESFNKRMENVSSQLKNMKIMWEVAADALLFFEESKSMLWSDVQPEILEDEAKKKTKALKQLHKSIRWCDAYIGLENEAKNFLIACPLVAQLGNQAMRNRHWESLKNAVGKDFASPDENDALLLSEVINLNLHEHANEVETIADQAVQEAKMETALIKLEQSWKNTIVFLEDGIMLKMSEDDFEALEADQLAVQGMIGSRFVGFFLEDFVDSSGQQRKGVNYWQQALSNVADVTTLLSDIQRNWSYLEPLFMKSQEVKKALPMEAEKFEKIDATTRAVVEEARTTKNILSACNRKNLLQELEETNEELEICKKALAEYLDKKRTIFPRFYFVSEADLLDILSNGSNPEKILRHVTKVFLATKTLELDTDGKVPTAMQWISGVGKEVGTFDPPVQLEGKVEVYLQDVLSGMQASMSKNFQGCFKRYASQPRLEWLLAKKDDNPIDLAQISLLVAGIQYVNEVESVFEAIRKGNKNAMRDYNMKQKTQLEDLIKTTLKDLDKADRQRVMCMITMDAHARDVVDRLITEGVSEVDSFHWDSQLKQRGSNEIDPRIDICNASFAYGYEYLGNGPRLVITPLTDRIYVTATQALHLKMGCAPAGPAGTGKTESTKDLASALGKCCYVFNCAPEMDYRSMGNIFKGLAASGSWGCFDEFNRLISEVLSVCTVQFKAVCDGIRAGHDTVTIEGCEVNLDNSCGAFITMNPGYLGRSTLPEGLKALFRPMTVMVPDLVLICENMLMAEGFVAAKELALKFFTLYSLLRDLLSKQSHYDWGLRAVKSVLVVAGSFKRAEPDLEEEDLLYRALRDFNIPKIVQQDEVIFHGLMDDLFPGRNPPRKISEDLEEAVKEACGARDLWPEETFMLKVVQLEELLAIRHCVFVMGPPGVGKTECWRTLQRARQLLGEKTLVRDINPKTQDPSGLYGYINLVTREWKDGILSKIMRDLGTMADPDPKWIVLDGDLDANWIESMNSVMDDNKMLTLASNERVPLYPHMRMIFEIRDLDYATPATVSRAGIIYISDNDQWRSIIAAWVQKKDWEDHIKEAMSELIEVYLPSIIKEFTLGTFKTIIPVTANTMVSNLLVMLDSMFEDIDLNKEQKQPKKKMEPIFTFCAAWAFGSALSEKDGVDYKKLYSDWWKSEFKTVKFPSRETIFDYFLDIEGEGGSKFDLWKNSSFFEAVQFDSSTMNMTNVTVPTPETCSVTYWMDKMIEAEKPSMLVGLSGCGKTNIITGTLQSLDTSMIKPLTINFNFYTNAAALQTTMESALEKKTGSNFGPPGTGNLIFFLDDLNLPEVDPYNTQDAIALVRQHLDYGHIFDKQKLAPKNILNCQYIAAMNHTAGSFHVNPRLQRHFVSFAIGFPSPTSLLTIYQTFLDGHLKNFDDAIKSLSSNIINGALGLHTDVMAKFRKSAKNFHYEFSLRHLSNVFQGLLTSQSQAFGNDGSKFVALWLHESQRVYGDRLVTADDLRKFNEMAAGQSKRRFPNFNMAKYFAQENADLLVFCHFADPSSSVADEDKTYDQSVAVATLRNTLNNALQDYNEMYSTMNLVLFDDAIKHVCKISRIIYNPAGHAMLVGVGGSGKQSLSKLASFMCGYETTQIVLSPTYSLNDFKEDIKAMYQRTGIKGDKLMFLFLDSQIVNERFLVYLNDLLASGRIPDLYTTEEIDGIVSAVFAKVKAAGLDTDRDSCYSYFINQVRLNLHCVLCFSPVGDDFRSRATKFPALINCTVIDWFQPWPMDALASVAESYVNNIDLPSDEIQQGVKNFMPFSFETVNQSASEFYEKEKRHVYTTPKSYLELLKLYSEMLTKKRNENRQGKDRLENGLQKLRNTAEVVGKLETDLKEKLTLAEQKKGEAEAQAEEVERESEIVARETEAANIEKEKCDRISTEVQAIKDDAQRDLDAAEPLVKKALEALNTLNKKDLGECKGMSTPPKGVDDVFNAVMVLMAGIHPNIVTTKAGKVKNLSWDGAKKEMMGNVNEFLQQLKDFKEEVDAFRVPKINWKEVRPLLALEHFDAESIEKKNKAAGGICGWVCNIVTYYDTIVGVEPKRQALAEAEEKLNAANEKLEKVNAKVNELETRLAALRADLAEANSIKQAAIDEVETGQLKLDLAQRLITALASENVRWAENVEKFERDYDLLAGDVLLASAFISYVGPFTKQYRDNLIKDKWVPFLNKAAAGEPIPMSETCDPLDILSTPADIASWNVNGLPSDSVSVENACITQCSERWPLIIDPQLQGINWILKNEADIRVGRLNQDNLITKLIVPALQQGKSVIIENMPERIDPALMPVIRRATITRGKRKFIKIADQDIEWHPDFKLFLHTKLSNPHYPPEIQAETTLVNFSVTQFGLEEQLLGLVVKKERADLAQQRSKLIQQQNKFTVRIKELEDNILVSLANADPDTITEDVVLIEGLEDTKRVANDIAEKSKIGKETQEMIAQVSEKYRSVAARGALLFFIMNSMHKLHTYYIYSLNAFVVIFLRGIDLVSQQKAGGPVSMMDRLRAAAKKVILTRRFNWNQDLLTADDDDEEDESDSKNPFELSKKPEADPNEDLTERCKELEKSITSVVYNYITRGLFDKDKLSIACLLAFKILDISPTLLQALLVSKPSMDPGNMGPLSEWMPENVWAAIKGLEHIEGLETLGDDIMSDSDDWRAWYEMSTPGEMPGDYSALSNIQSLLVYRAIRVDKLKDLLSNFVEENLGSEFVDQPAFDIEATYAETSPSTPILFVLFPGVDPTGWVEEVAQKMSIVPKSIAMGQGQEANAEMVLEEAAKNGGWVVLQNIHLMTSWLATLERKLETLSADSNPDFRVFLSAEPPPLPTMENLPESLMQSCIKVANQAPSGLKPNLRTALHTLKPENEPNDLTRKYLQTLCFFHSLVISRTRFGSIGWSRPYSFNIGDLTICSNIINSSKESGHDVDNLCYLISEIMYGGHVTDKWDRRYLSSQVQVLFTSDNNGINWNELEKIKDEPSVYGLAAAAELSCNADTANGILDSLAVLASGSTSEGAAGSDTISTISDLVQRLPPSLDNIKPQKDSPPYEIVLAQESSRMNLLLRTIRSSLEELKKGLNGSLNMTDSMEALVEALTMGRVPDMWHAKAYPSRKKLLSWFLDLIDRHSQLAKWIQQKDRPASVWLAGFFNPLAFLLAVKQTSCRASGIALSSTEIITEVLSRTDVPEEYSEEGTHFIHGLYIEGARWGGLDPIDEDEEEESILMEAKLKQLISPMPVIVVKAVKSEELNLDGYYTCPVYYTQFRGPTYLFDATLKTNENVSKWVLAGTALILQTDD